MNDVTTTVNISERLAQLVGAGAEALREEGRCEVRHAIAQRTNNEQTLDAEWPQQSRDVIPGMSIQRLMRIVLRQVYIEGARESIRNECFGAFAMALSGLRPAQVERCQQFFADISRTV